MIELYNVMRISAKLYDDLQPYVEIVMHDDWTIKLTSYMNLEIYDFCGDKKEQVVIVKGLDEDHL